MRECTWSPRGDASAKRQIQVELPLVACKSHIRTNHVGVPSGRSDAEDRLVILTTETVETVQATVKLFGHLCPLDPGFLLLFGLLCVQSRLIRSLVFVAFQGFRLPLLPCFWIPLYKEISLLFRVVACWSVCLKTLFCLFLTGSISACLLHSSRRCGGACMNVFISSIFRSCSHCSSMSLTWRESLTWASTESAEIVAKRVVKSGVKCPLPSRTLDFFNHHLPSLT